MSFISIIVSIFTVLATLISPRFTAPVPEASGWDEPEAGRTDS